MKILRDYPLKHLIFFAFWFALKVKANKNVMFHSKTQCPSKNHYDIVLDWKSFKSYKSTKRNIWSTHCTLFIVLWFPQFLLNSTNKIKQNAARWNITSSLIYIDCTYKWSLSLYDHKISPLQNIVTVSLKIYQMSGGKCFYIVIK